MYALRQAIDNHSIGKYEVELIVKFLSFFNFCVLDIKYTSSPASNAYLVEYWHGVDAVF
jgi:hypothetical protein